MIATNQSIKRSINQSMNQRINQSMISQRRPRRRRGRSTSGRVQRHIAIKFAYAGSDFHGYASQPSTIDQRAKKSRKIDEPVPTIEGAMFAVLKRCKLIEDEQSCRNQRCGRTDKGVHAADQTMSLWLRSKVRQGIGCLPPELIDHHTDDDIEDRIVIAAEEERQKSLNGTINQSIDQSNEFDYCAMMNKFLPPSIRAISFSPVPLDFSARHSCNRRTYHYLFFDDGMNLSLMREASSLLTGSHDFRNFCKIDPVNVCHFTRTIHDIRIEPFRSAQFTDNRSNIIGATDSMHVLIIEGSSASCIIKFAAWPQSSSRSAAARSLSMS